MALASGLGTLAGYLSPTASRLPLVYPPELRSISLMAGVDGDWARLTTTGLTTIVGHLKLPSERKNIMAEGILEIEDSSFDAEVLQSDKPVLVDFWAPWCGPCRAIAPVIDELMGTYGDRIKFTKCNVDDNPVTPSKFGIKAIPTLIFFKEGNVVEQVTGMVAKSKLAQTITSIL